jgi:hypothetical protein
MCVGCQKVREEKLTTHATCFETMVLLHGTWAGKHHVACVRKRKKYYERKGHNAISVSSKKKAPELAGLGKRNNPRKKDDQGALFCISFSAPASQ